MDDGMYSLWHHYELHSFVPSFQSSEESQVYKAAS